MDFKDKKCLLVRCFKMEVYSANSVHHALNFVDSDDHMVLGVVICLEVIATFCIKFSSMYENPAASCGVL